MSEKRLSKQMGDSVRSVEGALETLDDAITQAINNHFDCGREYERERIVEMLQEQATELYGVGFTQGGDQIQLAISFIKGENNGSV